MSQRATPLTMRAVAAAAAISIGLGLSACGSSNDGADDVPTAGVASSNANAKVDASKQVPVPAAGKATKAAISIGFPYLDWLALEQAGFPIAYRKDDPKQVEALVDFVNSHGGFGGHKIVAEPAKVALQDPNATRAACLKFTRELKLFMVIDVTAFQYAPNTNCITTQGGALLTNIYPGDEANFAKRFPLHRSPVAPDEEAARTLVTGGKEAGFFDGEGKVGILANGCDPASTISGPRGLNSALDKVGVSADQRVLVTAKCKVRTPDPNAAQTALLKFKQEGVTKVIGATGSAVEKGFTLLAERQGFKPKWLLGDFTRTLLNTNLLNAENIDGAYGVTGSVQNYADSPGAKVCSDIFAAKGLPRFTVQRVDLVAGYLCEQTIQSMQIANKAVEDDGELTKETFAKAAQSIGAVFTAQSYGVTFEGKDQAGSDKVALVRYSKDCKCWNMSEKGIIDAIAK